MRDIDIRMPLARARAPAPVHGVPRVAVIGGGPAGLVAAAHLVRAGLRVDLFEARHRVGGRVYTRKLQGAVVNGGATFVTAEREQAGLCRDCENRFYAQVQACGHFAVCSDSEGWRRLCSTAAVAADSLGSRCRERTCAGCGWPTSTSTKSWPSWPR